MKGPRVLLPVGIVFALALFLAMARGEPPARPEAPVEADSRAREPVVRAYDIRDLIVNIPDFTDAPTLVFGQLVEHGGSGQSVGSFSGPTGQFPETGKTREQTVDGLIHMIMETTQPDTWKETGGQVGAIRESAGILVVQQTPECQKQVQELLSEYRRLHISIPVRIRAHWVLARRSAFAGLLKPAGLAAAALPAAGDGAGKRDGPSALEEADDSALDQIHGAIHFRGELLCCDGQRVCVVAGHQQSNVDGSTDEEANAGSNPTTASQVGALVLDVQNVVGSDRDRALLTIRSGWASPGGPAPHQTATRPATGPSTRPAAAGASVMTDVGFHEIKTSACLPIGKMILIGGMTLDPTTAAANQPGNADSDKVGSEPPQLYLFIEVTEG